MSKLKQFFLQTIPLPNRLDKILHVRVPRYLSIILIILFGFPVILTIILNIIQILFALYLFFIYEMGVLPPDRINYLGLAVIMLISLAIILPLYSRLKRCPAARIVRLTIVVMFVELIAFFWYQAWWREYMHYWNNVYINDFKDDFAIENGLYMIRGYLKALFQTVSVTLLLVIPWLFLKNDQKHNS